MLVVAGGLVIWRTLPAMANRLQYGTFDLSAPPERVDYCGRRYYPGNGEADAAQWHAIGAAAVAHGLEPMRQIGSTPGGFSYFANLTPTTVRNRFSPPLPCTMLIYVRIADRYRVYGLSGGP